MDIETLALAKKYTDEHGGGGGGSYTAGDGIKIQHNEISVKTKSNGGITVNSDGASVDTDALPYVTNSDTILITASGVPGASGVTYTINKSNLEINTLYSRYGGNVKAVLKYTYNGTNYMISDSIRIIGNGNVWIDFSSCGDGYQRAYQFTYTTSNVLSVVDASENVSTLAGTGISVYNGYISVKSKANGGIAADAEGVYVDTTKIQSKLTQGTNITISGNTISATDTTYSAGNGISISGTTVSSKLKSNQGLRVDSNGLYVDKNSTLEIDSNNKLGVASSIVAQVQASIMHGTASGSVASFVDGGNDIPMKSCIVSIEPVQSGSGDPSPSNVRAISGWTECNITVADDETTPTISNVYNIEFPSEAGTVYGGNLDVTNGVLTVSKVFIDLGSLSWSVGYDGFYASLASLVKADTTLICEIYKQVTSYNNRPDYSLYWENNNKFLLVKDSRYTDTTAYTTAMDGVKLVYELATPTTYNLTSTEVKTLLGINNIFADCGDVLNCYYYTQNARDIADAVLSLIPSN